MVSCICLGFGVFTTTDFQKGEFLLDYRGTLKSQKDAEDVIDQTYIYYFQLGNMTYRYDCMP